MPLGVSDLREAISYEKARLRSSSGRSEINVWSTLKRRGVRLLQLAAEKGLNVTRPTVPTRAIQAPATAQPAAHGGLSITRPISTAAPTAQRVRTTEPKVIIDQPRDEAKASSVTDDDECIDKKSVDVHNEGIDELFKRSDCPPAITRAGFRVLDTLESSFGTYRGKVGTTLTRHSIILDADTFLINAIDGRCYGPLV